jgi:hypothetical protein
MNKIGYILILALLFSCNKEKRYNKYLAGNWNIEDYSEVIFDGTLNKYTVINGEAKFDKLNGNSEAGFQLSFKALNNFDTVEKNLTGTYKRISLDTLEFNMDTVKYIMDINRIYKTDLNLQGGFEPNRKSIFIMKKK